MGRPPCCDKVGIKKGPWTPEEDILLVSYIQEHGPGNWRSVPTNTGLLRCSKSCRLRWTNYLRPGIKRGNFTPHEEGMIVHLQALLGNKWAAIASYLPQRTDNDIKNYWNTHLKKKLKKLQSCFDTSDPTKNSQLFSMSLDSRTCSSSSSSLLPKQSAAASYYSSTENISRLLEGWMGSSPKANSSPEKGSHGSSDAAASAAMMASSDRFFGAKTEQEISDGLGFGKEFESVASYENLKSNLSNKSCESGEKVYCENRLKTENNHPPLSYLEKWLLDETAAVQVEEMVALSPMF